MKFKLSRELPKIIEKYKTLSPADLHRLILQDLNKDVSVKAIGMFFNRHSQMKKEYEAVFSSAANSQIEVSGNLFMNGNFKEVPSVKKWMIEKATLVSPSYMANHV